MVARRSLVFNLILVSAPVLNMECNYHNITNWQNDDCQWKCGFLYDRRIFQVKGKKKQKFSFFF